MDQQCSTIVKHWTMSNVQNGLTEIAGVDIDGARKKNGDGHCRSGQCPSDRQ